MNSLSGYPQFMQNLNNPMQSGFNWSSFGYPMNNGIQVKRESNSFPNNKTGLTSPQQTQDQLRKLLEDVGSLSQNLGMKLPTGAVDIRQALVPNQIGMPTNASNARQILHDMYPGINALMYCQDYCDKKKLILKYTLVEEQPPLYKFVMKVETYKGGPSMLTSGTDIGKNEAKRRAAEEMIPQLLQAFGPLKVNPAHFRASLEEQRSNSSKWAKLNDSEWAKQISKMSPNSSHPTCLLYAWAQRKGLERPTYVTTSEEIPEADLPQDEPEAPKTDTLTAEDNSPSAKRAKLEARKPRMYTVICTFQNKQFIGKDMKMKKAKMAASEAAWNEFCPKF